jgi:hypothetical protein
MKYFKAHGKRVKAITAAEWSHIAGAFIVGAFTRGVGLKIASITKTFGMKWYTSLIAKANWGIKSYFLNNASKGLNPLTVAKIRTIP